MLKIGITVGIGSGKTTVCKLCELLRIPVYYADIESKNILSSDVKVKQQVLSIFGNGVLNEQQRIDRKKLAELVFNDKKALEQLNGILHPAVGLHFENWVKKQTAPYCLKEAAILFESGAYKQVDKVITVLAPLELKVSRAIKRGGITKEEVLARIENQLSDEEKAKRSDFTIINNEQELVIPQVLLLHTQLLVK
ncbi:dephospho-CoA kinase [soil metagenome]